MPPATDIRGQRRLLQISDSYFNIKIDAMWDPPDFKTLWNAGAHLMYDGERIVGEGL